MDEMNFFEAFGLDNNIFASAMPAKKEEKKAEKKASSTAKKADKKPAPEVEVSLPVTVKARSFEKRMEPDGAFTTMKLSQIWDKLAEEYPQFGIGSFELVYSKEVQTVYVCDSAISASSDDTQAFADGVTTIRVCDGGIVCEVEASSFDGLEPDEVTAGDVRDRFVEANPRYEGCSLYIEGDVAYPIFVGTSKKDGSMQDVYICGNPSPREMTDSLKTALVSEILGEDKNVSLSVGYGRQGAFVSFRRAAGRMNFTKMGTAAKGTAKAVEKKYPLPMRLHVANFNCDFNLDSTMFGGAEKVTKDEITKAMAAKEPLFADTDRKIEYMYQESAGVMSCMFISGKKGAC